MVSAKTTIVGEVWQVGGNRDGGTKCQESSEEGSVDAYSQEEGCALPAKDVFRGTIASYVYMENAESACA